MLAVQSAPVRFPSAPAGRPAGAMAMRPAPDRDVGAMAKAARLTFPRDAEIFAQQSPARRLFRVERGAVRTVALLGDGRRQIGAFYFPGDWFGIEAGPVHRFAAEAVAGPTVVIGHDRAAIIALGQHPGPGMDLTGAMVQELSRAQDHLMLLGRKTAGEKVATFLRDLDVRGVRDLPMRRQDIADYLGLTIETVSRMLTQLQNAGLIRICNARNLEVLDRRALEQIAAA